MAAGTLVRVILVLATAAIAVGDNATMMPWTTFSPPGVSLERMIASLLSSGEVAFSLNQNISYNFAVVPPASVQIKVFSPSLPAPALSI